MNRLQLRNVWRPTILALAIGQIGWSTALASALPLKLSHTLMPRTAPATRIPQALMAPVSAAPLLLVTTASLPNRADASSPAQSAPVSAHWASQAPQWLPGQSACTKVARPNWDRLTLSDALALNMCQSPALRQALASVAELTAGVTIAEVAKRPRWTASLSGNVARNFVPDSTLTRSADLNLGLSWVLLDFGAADANTASARQTLLAALATQNDTTLESVRELVQRYGNAVVADAALQATTDAQATAQLTAEAAQARYDAGAGNQIDRLQALTSLAQATLAQVRAQADWENARAQLALALGADIAQPMRLTDWEVFDQSNAPPPAFADLRVETRLNHPRIRAIDAQIKALESQLASAQATNRGSVSLSTNLGHTRNWGISGTNATNITNIPNASVGLTLSMPLFNGTEANAQQAQIVAQTDARVAEREAIQRELDIQLWQAHRAVITSLQSVAASERLLIAANQTYEVAQGRYKAGVGSMVDLLTAQADLADGRRQRVAALVERVTALTNLNLAAGRIGAQ
jgi:outer membrane protein